MSRRPHFQSLKEFLEIYDRYGKDEEAAVEGYSKYKQLYLEEQYKYFFEHQKKFEWFQELFAPAASANRQAIMKANIEQRQEIWKTQLGDMNISLVEKVETASAETSKEKDGMDLEEGEDIQSKDVSTLSVDQDTMSFYLKNFGNSSPFILIRSIQPSITRQMLLDVCSQIPDFSELFLSLPSVTKRWHKAAWVTFRKQGGSVEDTLLEASDDWIDEKWKALDGLVINQFELRATLFSKSDASQMKFRLAHSHAGSLEQMQKDLLKSMYMIQKLSSYYKVELPDFYLEEPEFSEALLDKSILYLRSIFNFCFYCGMPFENYFEMRRDCGTLHLRKSRSSPEGAGKGSPGSSAILEQRMDDFVTQLFLLQESHQKISEKDFSAVIEERLLKQHVVPQEAAESTEEGQEGAKSRCGICSKLFRSPDFVVKHLKLKHVEEVENIRTQLAMQDVFEATKSMFKDAILADRSSEQRVNSSRGGSFSASARKPDPDRYYGSGYPNQYLHREGSSYERRPSSYGAHSRANENYSHHRMTPYASRPQGRERQDVVGNRELKSYTDLDAPSPVAKPKIDYGSFPID